MTIINNINNNNNNNNDNNNNKIIKFEINIIVPLISFATRKYIIHIILLKK